MSDLLADTERLILIDGSGYIFRAYHVMPPMTRPDGTPVNAVRGFCQMLVKLLDDCASDRIAVIFDAGRFSFRNDLYDAYKANRPEPPDDLVPQFPLTREASRAFGLPTIEIDGFEADDIIATYARRASAVGRPTTIVSSDKDLMQLVDDQVAMWDPMKTTPIGPEQVREKFGVDPDRVVDVQALAGDSVDNVPGVPGIGVKTAAQLIAEYGDLETLLARAGEIKQTKRRENLIAHADDARISKQLVTLRDDVPVDLDLEDLIRPPLDQDKATAFLEENAFKTLLARLQGEWGVAPTAAAAPSVAAVERRYTLVTDADTLADWVDRARDAGVVAVDTETSSLDAMRAELVGVSLAVAPGEACYIPLAHIDDLGVRPAQLAAETALTALKPLLEDPLLLKIGQNIKYDMLVLANQSPAIQIAPIDDTMVMSYVADGSQHGHGMDELARLHFDIETIKYEEVCGKGKSQIPFARVPLDRALAYAAEDADVTLRLWRLLKRRVVELKATTVYETLDRPLIAVLAGMERRGIGVDRAELARLSADFGGRIAALEKEIHALAGRPFTIGSPKQLGAVLFDELGLPAGRKTKTGWSTDADTLEPLAAQGHDIVAKVLNWRSLSKLKSTYADALVEDIDPKTGRVHTRFSQTVANTGRLSSNDPNLQNIPVRTEEGRRIRNA
ncbi:MAG: DNA polymerase I, partial [Pseudomonadota bacterium]